MALFLIKVFTLITSLKKESCWNSKQEPICLARQDVRGASSVHNEVKLNMKYIPYSLEQKHVSISDTPMLPIEINSIM